MIRRLKMKNYNAKWGSLLIIIVSLSGWALAENGGGYAGASFRYGSDARSLALGGALVAEPNPGFHQFSNPAVGMFTINQEVALSFMNLSLDRTIQTAGFNKELLNGASVGLSFFRAGTDNIVGRDPMGRKTGDIQVSDKIIIITFSQLITDQLAMGFNLKTVFNNLGDQVDGRGIAVDIGWIYSPHQRIRAGINVNNIFGNTTWKFQSGTTRQEDLLTFVSSGISVSPIDPLRLLAQWDTYFIPDRGYEGKLRIGVEYQVFDILMLRGGVNDKRPTLGFGLAVPWRNMNGFTLNYAIDPGISGEGISHIYSCSIRL